MQHKYCFIPLNEQILDRFKTWAKVCRYYFTQQLPNAQLLNKTLSLRGIHQGRSAFVLGCGPSLNKYDLRKLARYQKEKKFNVFAVNSYLFSDHAKILTPDYYFLSDPVAFGSKTGYGSANDAALKNQMECVWQKIKGLKLPLFVPLGLYDRVDLLDKFPFCDQENIYSVNVDNPLKPRGYVSMTVLKALTMALFMGHEKIYIAGMDCSDFKHMVVDKENVLYLDYNHFFNPKHNRLQYYHVANMCEMLYAEHLLFQSFGRFSGYPIVNLDPDGLLDCFSKKHNLDVY